MLLCQDYFANNDLCLRAFCINLLPFVMLSQQVYATPQPTFCGHIAIVAQRIVCAMSQQVKSRNGMAHQPSKTNTVELQSQLRVEDRSLSAFTVPLLLRPLHRQGLAYQSASCRLSKTSLRGRTVICTSTS